MTLKPLPFVITILSLSILFGLKVLVEKSNLTLIRNFSDSERKGLFIVREKKGYKRGDLILISFPEKLRKLARKRKWLQSDMPLFKTIKGVAGDRVCHKRKYLIINRKRVAKIYKRDNEGKVLPQIRGCYIIPKGHFLPIGTKSDKSFDGRYFGVVSEKFLIGKLISFIPFNG